MLHFIRFALEALGFLLYGYVPFSPMERASVRVETNKSHKRMQTKRQAKSVQEETAFSLPTGGISNRYSQSHSELKTST